MTSNKLISIATLAAVLLLVGCGNSGDGVTSFRQNGNDAKVILYPVYDNPEEKGLFSETFRFYIDGGFAGEIGDEEYVEMSLPPGEYDITADEIGWSGNILNHSTLKVAIKPHEAFYAAEHVLADEKTALTKTGANIGAKDIAGRKQDCSC